MSRWRVLAFSVAMSAAYSLMASDTTPPGELINSVDVDRRFAPSQAIGDDGTVFATFGNSNVVKYGIMALSPELNARWQHQLDSNSPGSGRDISWPVISHDGREVYAVYTQDPPSGPQKTYFTAHDTTDGRQVWGFSPNNDEPQKMGQPAVDAEGAVYIVVGNNKLKKYFKSNKVIWNVIIGRHLSAPSISLDTVYVVDTAGFLHAIDKDSAQIVWSRSLTFAASPSSAEGFRPAIGYDGSVYVATDAYVYAFAIDGKLKWQHSATQGIKRREMVISQSGKILYLSSDNYIKALSLETGQASTFFYNGAYGFESMPVVSSDRYVFIAPTTTTPQFLGISETGQVTAFTDPGMPQNARSIPVIGNNGYLYGTTNAESYDTNELFVFHSHSPGLATMGWSANGGNRKHNGLNNNVQVSLTVDNSDATSKAYAGYVPIYGDVTSVVPYRTSSSWTLEPASGATGVNGTDYHLATTNHAFFEWRFSVPADGQYELRAGIPNDGRGCEGVEYRVPHESQGSIAIDRNQLTSLGSSMALASVPLVRGKTYTVRLKYKSGSGKLLADAITARLLSR